MGGSMKLKCKPTRAGVSVLQVVLIGGLLATLVALGCAGPINGPPDNDNGPQVPDQPVREVPDLVQAGDEFQITVTLVSPGDGFHAIGLTEIAPSGWEVSVDVAWTEPRAWRARTQEAETAEYIWEGPYDAGVEFTAVFKVRVPVDAEPGSYAFSGLVKYYIEPHPAPSYEKETAGDMTVTVSS